GLDGLEKFFDHINHAFLIGESTKEFSAWFDTYGIKHSRCYTMENAVGQAHAMAQAHRGKPVGTGVVLLSPACASFDQYESFEKRGEHFSQLVDALKKD
ncbi:MAG: UDP-N-acetylmuramoyl-L-alanine--D-glutamate ligase, partial [Alphaproteobacteria bacterium]|nr:UDP-N-acetylmuramoyl-L-alanine--D-glutamate ligase [Alphaproteobacteria bacterium]